MNAYVRFIKAVVDEQLRIREFMEEHYRDLIKSKDVFTEPIRWRGELEESLKMLTADEVNVERAFEEDCEVVKKFIKFLFSIRKTFFMVVREYHQSSRACTAWEIHELLMAEHEYYIGYVTGRYDRNDTLL